MRKILVIGAMHIDAISFPDADVAAGVIDKPGSVVQSLGGTGFNIAANLAAHRARSGVKVSLMTVVARGSLLDGIAETVLHDRGIVSLIVRAEDTEAGNGFVAIVSNRAMASAVSASVLSGFSLPAAKLEKHMADSDTVVVDTNVSQTALEQVLTLAALHRRSVVVCGSSDAKVPKIQDASVGRPFDIAVLNSHEAKALGVDWQMMDGPAACKAVGASVVVVTAGRLGHVILDQKLGRRLGHPPHVNDADVVSEVGAGDAFCAAVCDLISDGTAPDWAHLAGKIETYVPPILRVRWATVGAERVSLRGTSTTPMLETAVALAAVSLTVCSVSLALMGVPGTRSHFFALCVPFLMVGGVLGVHTRGFIPGDDPPFFGHPLRRILIGVIAGLLVAIGSVIPTFLLAHQSAGSQSVSSGEMVQALFGWFLAWGAGFNAERFLASAGVKGGAEADDAIQAGRKG